ncbi:tRNA (adenosine(37)-N6)-dimethylallyltransferase MiaA [Streptococcus dentapri]|uniref:tRNA dimethylallyltransferase n=1 Tax=Streptococcus dentapri TaxID=573564 RepID=A0ABV8CZZ1_9STRE
MKTKVVVIAGPTAVGKTALGIELAQKFQGEIISGDSQQVYRHLNIGTAKASRKEQAEVPHHLLDVREPYEHYSVYDFVQEAKMAITAIVARGKLPIIVGGTGLYLQSLLEGYHLGGDLNQAALLDYRKELESLSDAELVEKMADIDQVIEQPNRRRLIRALELTKFGQQMENQETDYDACIIGLNSDRQKLYQRINQRVNQMMEQGLLNEARWLYENHPHSQAAKAIGYKEFFSYFEGQQDLETAREKLKQNTRRFAKRQLTWFRNRMAVHFYDISDPHYHEAIDQVVTAFLEGES